AAPRGGPDQIGQITDGLKAEIKDGIVYSPYPEIEIPMCSLYAVVEQSLLRFGDKAALVQHADSFTYPEMLSLLRRYSAGFQARGIGRGDRITCCLSNTLENFVALFGVIFAGATTILTEPVLTPDELTFQVTDSASKYILTDSENAPKFQGLQTRADIKELMVVGSWPGFFSVSAFQDISDTSFKEVSVPDTRNEIAAICYSSGTTGSPKAVEITHYSFIAGMMSLMKIRSQFCLECFRNLYGLSEALSPACMPCWDETDFDNIGFPASSVQFKVVDVETGLPVGPYTTGELHIKTPAVTRGYSRKTGTVSAVDENGWLASGDLVYYNEDGRFYYYERMKSLIKCLDYEVAPCELEEILLSHPFVAEAVVVGVLHSEFGEVAKAFVVIKDSVCQGMSPTSEELQEFVA
ncbi:hypothetical protein HPB47_024082, partial [Ixodes persulcatus]